MSKKAADLEKVLWDSLEEISNNEVTEHNLAKAKTIAQVSGNILKSAQLQLVNKKLTGHGKPIEFFQ